MILKVTAKEPHEKEKTWTTFRDVMTILLEFWSWLRENKIKIESIFWTKLLELTIRKAFEALHHDSRSSGIETLALGMKTFEVPFKTVTLGSQEDNFYSYWHYIYLSERASEILLSLLNYLFCHETAFKFSEILTGSLIAGKLSLPSAIFFKL